MKTTEADHKSETRFAVEISPDRLIAKLKFNIRAQDALPTQEELVQAVGDAELVVDDAMRKRIEELVASWEVEKEQTDGQDNAEGDSGAERRDAEIVIAKGRPAKDGVDAVFVWDPVFGRQERDPDSDEAVDYYTFNSIITVEEETVLGTITPLVPEQDGIDVLGQAIPPRRKAMPLEVHESVRRTEDEAGTVMSTIAGRVVYRDHKLSIVEVLDIRGDVDFETGNIDSSIAVNIKGTVRDRFKVKSKATISIGGAIESADIESGEDVAVAGGVAGRHAGSVRADSDVGAKFGDEAHLFAGNDIVITKELMNSFSHAGGHLNVQRGAIIGGIAYAGQQIDVGTVGSEANVATRLAAGIHPLAYKQAAELSAGVEAKLAAVEKIRSAVQPLIANLKRLSPAQKEQATELLFKADEAEMQIKNETQSRTELIDEGRFETPPRIVIHQTLHPRATVSIGDRSATIHEIIKGPVAIEKRVVDRVTELVLVNQLTGSITVLPNGVPPIEDLCEGFEIETEQDESEEQSTE